jgi:septum formation protein
LLKSIGVTPDEIISPDIDETPRKGELPQDYVQRVAAAKAQAIASSTPNAVILAADTAVACGRRILPKAQTQAQARECLKLLSGRRHRVYTAVAVYGGGTPLQKTVMTQVRFNRLSEADIDWYIASGEWEGKAGGYAIQGAAAAFIPAINGSWSNVVGLPLMETRQMLERVGIK